MTGIVPISGVQQFDKDSDPPAFLNGGLLYVYLPGTTTPAAVFSDFGLTTALPFPIVLNTVGRIPAIYGANLSVRLRLLSGTGVTQFDEDNVALVVAQTGSVPIVTSSSQLWTTGDVKTRYDDAVIDGFVRGNGRTIGSATSGATERANSDCLSLFTFLWAFANISVVTGKGASAAADWSANKQLTLPNFAGRLLGARDDLGNGAAGRITAATVTGPTLVGAAGGLETIALDSTMIPAHTHASPALTDPGHTHTTTAYNNSATTTLTAGANGAVSSLITSSNSTSGITLAPNTGSTGGGLAHSNMPPVMLLTVYIKL